MTSLCRFLFSSVLIFGTALTPISVFGQALSDPAVLRREFQKPQNNQLAARCQLVTSQLKVLFPKASVRVFPEGDRIVVQGRAANTSNVERILTIVKCSIAPDIPQIEIVEDAGHWSETHVVDRITVQRHQINLHVTVYHLNGKELNDSGLSMVDLLRDAGDPPLVKRSVDTGWLIGLFDKKSVVQVIRKFDEAPGLNALLAPDLVVASGHTASFLSGGEVAVPSIVRTSGDEQEGKSATSFKPFGTSLLIRPDVMDDALIRLDLTLDLSRLCPHAINGTPHVDSHNERTVALMKPGQVVAIAGIDTRLAEGEPDSGIIRAVAGKIASKVRGGKEPPLDELLILIRPEIIQQETAVRVSTNQPSATEWSTKHAILRRTTPSR